MMFGGEGKPERPQNIENVQEKTGERFNEEHCERLWSRYSPPQLSVPFRVVLRNTMMVRLK